MRGTHPEEENSERRPTTEKLLGAAIEAFSRRGLSATTREIAQAAGVNEATLFRQFATKEHLLEAVTREIVSEKTAGIVIEWIQGEGGINPMTTEYALKARELADRFNALLVFDEIQCGVGRPGTYFAYQLSEPVILPDIMVAAKPLACGIPLGVIVANEKAAAAIAPGMHGSTYGGGPLACRVALEFCDILDELLPHIRQTGAYFRMRLDELARHHSFVKEVRGQGLMIGVELTVPCKQLVRDALDAGLLINCTHEHVLRMLPPYIITEPQVDQAVKVLARLFRRVKSA